MNASSRREFLADVGRGMFVAALGPMVAYDLGLSSGFAAELEADSARLTFGSLEPLVGLLQDTPPDKLLPEAVKRLKSGTDLKQLTAAAALANARSFGGEHYRGYHTFMALMPAYQISQECSDALKPLAVLKVLYRNSDFIQTVNGQEILHPIEPLPEAISSGAGSLLRDAYNQRDVNRADRIFAAMSQGSLDDAFNDLLEYNVDDHAGVHETVLVWRAWSLLDFTGREHANTLLRQSVRQCLSHVKSSTNTAPDARIALLARLLDEHHLPEAAKQNRTGDDAWVSELCETILSSNASQAADAVAGALADGFNIEHIGEAISLAANQLVLRQVANWEGVRGTRAHGDSPGVHASDAVNAWRNIARVSNHRNAVAAMILAAYFVAESHYPTDGRMPKGHEKVSFPRPEQLAELRSSEPSELLADLDRAIRNNDQFRACAIVEKYGQTKSGPQPVFNLLRGFTISEDGRLHGEKYYRTAAEEFATTRPAFRWNQLTALARVTASAYGYTLDDARTELHAPGYDEACRLLGVNV
jgi:hypothetical protein